MRLAALLCSVCLVLSAAAESDGGFFGGAYVGASGVVTIPQGGSSMRRLGGANFCVGFDIAEDCSLEAIAGCQERMAFLAVQELVHFYTFEVYDRFFGYSPFDPFFTFGASGWLGDGKGQVGPTAGIGAFWHLDDNWSVRADAAATLGLDADVEMVYSVSVGLQYSFGS